jgi:hypothetical protein
MEWYLVKHKDIFTFPYIVIIHVPPTITTTLHNFWTSNNFIK